MKYLLLLLALPCFGQVVTRTVCGPGGPISQNTGISAGEQVNAQSGTSYTYQNTDCGKLVKHSNGSAIAASLPHANTTTFRAGWFMDVSNAGVGTVTITPVTSTIDGLATLALLTSEGVRIVSNGTNYFTIRGKVTSGGGGGTVTNVGTTAPITGGPITTTGTIGCATCVVGPGSATSGHIATFNGTGGVLIQDGGAPATGTVTSIATTSPITGGTVTTTGTIACASCVTSATPGAGVAHFAGSTQAVTSSAIVNGDITNSTIDLTAKVTGTLPVANGGTGITSLGTGVATALGANVSGSGAICLASGSTCAGGGGGATESHTASNSSVLNFTTCIGAGTKYRIYLDQLLPATNDVDITLQVGTSGTYDTGANYGWNRLAWVAGGTGPSGVNSGATSITLSHLVKNTSNWGITGTYYFSGPATSSFKLLTGSTAGLMENNVLEGEVIAGGYLVATTFNNFRIQASSGNLASGKVSCYAIAD